MEVPTLEFLIAIQHLADAHHNLKDLQVRHNIKEDKHALDRDMFLGKYKSFLPLDVVHHEDGYKTVNPKYGIVDGERVIVGGYVYKGNTCVGHADQPGAKGFSGPAGIYNN